MSGRWSASQDCLSGALVYGRDIGGRVNRVGVVAVECVGAVGELAPDRGYLKINLLLSVKVVGIERRRRMFGIHHVILQSAFFGGEPLDRVEDFVSTHSLDGSLHQNAWRRVGLRSRNRAKRKRRTGQNDQDSKQA